MLGSPNAHTRFWTSNQATYFACKHAQQKEFLAKFFPLFTLRVSSLLLRLKSKRKRTRKETTVGDLFSCWLPLLDSNQRHPVSTKLPNGQFGMFACSLNTSIPQAEPQTMPSAALCATICDLRCRWLEPTKKKRRKKLQGKLIQFPLQGVGYELSSRIVANQVFSPLQRLTSVFGMGTGGPTALK